MKPIMSVDEARELLGQEYGKLADEQIAEIVRQADELAGLALDVARNKILRENISDESHTTLSR